MGRLWVFLFIFSFPVMSCVPSLEKRAQQGDSDAQYILASQYFEEFSVRNSGMAGEKAILWLKRSAENGNAQAQCHWGNLLFDDPKWPIYRDKLSAVAWYEKSAAQNNAEAQFRLANIYDPWINDTTLKIEPDVVRAFDLYQKSAAQGYALAYYPLSAFYIYGVGVEPDLVKGFSLLRMAAIEGDSSACVAMGNFFMQGRKPCRQNYQAAINWYVKAAEQNVAYAQVALGDIYIKLGFRMREHETSWMPDHLKGADRNFKKAVYWFSRAAQRGHMVAQHNLGIIYCEGYGVEKNISTAVSWLKRAADQGYVPSENALAYIKYQKQ